MACKLRDKAIELFKESFNDRPSVYAYAPGRVNFIGEHTDYCEGFVCPLAIHYGTAVVGKLVPGNTCRVVSANMEGMCEFKGDSSLTRDESGSWVNYVAGVVYEFITRFGKKEVGFDMAIAADVPIGSGLSSSASLEVAVSVFLEQILCVALSPEDRALACLKGNLLLIDCRANKGELVPMADPSVSIIVCNSNKKHQLTGSEYPDRVAQCKQALVLLQAKYPEVHALRDASVEQVEALKEAMGDVVYRRALHVVSECQRCLACKEALERRDYEKVGLLLYQSHASLRDNFEVSTPEIDILVEIASEQDGVFGARITGGGFGGCVVCFVQSDKAEAVMRAMETEYKARTGIECSAFITSPEQGARVMNGFEVDEEPSQAISVVKRPLFWFTLGMVVLGGAFLIMRRRR
ncbi:galactokinase [Blastocystis sp. ATCC 50177/Nand II]|uniref:Galactokinase n=1 Tax=Blastocystis sp. subtype 1 (strain ATCC 50177 / NandII) TaxID=478820 RepID=A0A196S7G4_BLAHN|nr:galactokinase [Blastocystis sp. ATCC 50177/Nand II]